MCGMISSPTMISTWWLWITIFTRLLISQHSQRRARLVTIMGPMLGTPHRSNMRSGSANGPLQLMCARTGSEGSMMATLSHKLNASGSNAPRLTFRKTFSRMLLLTPQSNLTDLMATVSMATFRTFWSNLGNVLRILYSSMMMKS